MTSVTWLPPNNEMTHILKCEPGETRWQEICMRTLVYLLLCQILCSDRFCCSVCCGYSPAQFRRLFYELWLAVAMKTKPCDVKTCQVQNDWSKIDFFAHNYDDVMLFNVGLHSLPVVTSYSIFYFLFLLKLYSPLYAYAVCLFILSYGTSAIVGGMCSMMHLCLRWCTYK